MIGLEESGKNMEGVEEQLCEEVKRKEEGGGREGDGRGRREDKRKEEEGGREGDGRGRREKRRKEEEERENGVQSLLTFSSRQRRE